MTARHGAGWLALLLYLGVGHGVPVVDATLAHQGLADRGHHVEAAGEQGCHHDRCLLEAPRTPQAAAQPLLAAAAIPAPPFVVPQPFVTTRQHPRRPERPLGPRAPPHLG